MEKIFLSLPPAYRDHIYRSKQSRINCGANCSDCEWIHDRKTELFKTLSKDDNTSAVADLVKTTGHNIK